METITYAGRRIDGTKALHAYEVDGVLRFWAKPLRRGIAIGQGIEVEIKRDEKGRASITALGSSTGPIDDADKIAEWSVADKIAATSLARITHDRQLARDAKAADPVEQALDVISKALQAQRGIGARAAFIDYANARMLGSSRGER
jgi:hypothetical protein